MARAPHGGILRSLRTLAFFSARRAIDMKVLTDLSVPPTVVCDRLIANGSRSGAIDLQRWDAQSPEHKLGKNRRIATSVVCGRLSANSGDTLTA